MDVYSCTIISQRTLSPMKHLIYDCSAIGKPKTYKVSFSDTFNWPRMIHLSWILLDENLKPISDYDCIVKPEGFAIDNKIEHHCKIDLEDITSKGEALEDILKQFNDSVEDSDYLWCHNQSFNENVVAAEFLRKGLNHSIFKKERFCLMQESTWFCKLPSKIGGYKWPSQTELHSIIFKKAYTPANNARADVIAASRCFIALMKINQLEDCFDDD